MRKVYVLRDGELRDKSTVPPVRNHARSDLGCPQLMPDIQEFVSPIDNSVITSRTLLKQHEQKHNVVQVGDAWEGKVPEMRARRQEQAADAWVASAGQWLDYDSTG